MNFKRLSTRFIVNTLIVMAISSTLAFILSNVYYHFYEKDKNDARITETLLTQKEFIENDDYRSAEEIFNQIASLDFQLVVIKDGKKEFYGYPFRVDNLPEEPLEKEEIYHGIKNRPFNILITGFFDNETKNTVGTNITINNETYSVFMRPSVGDSMGEFRIFLAILLILLIVFSIIFVALSSNLIVAPVVQLKNFAQKIRFGKYDSKNIVNRRDEIGTLQREMARMSQAIKEQQETNERFVANVSHEIQSPIANLLMQLEALKQSNDEATIKTMEHQAKRLSGLTKQLLLLASIEQSESQLETEYFKAKPFINELVQSHMYMLDQKEIFLMTHVEDIEIYGNSHLLFQAFTNLLTNAIKYTENFGEITISVNKEEHNTKISIEDNGIGMSEETKKHLFERFYKDHRAEDNVPSNGLGMAIVKEIIDLHGGEIEVESREGEGTKIVVIV